MLVLYPNSSGVSLEAMLTIRIACSHWSIFEFLASDFPKTSYTEHIARPILSSLPYYRLLVLLHTIFSFDAEKEGDKVLLMAFHFSPSELRRFLASASKSGKAYRHNKYMDN